MSWPDYKGLTVGFSKVMGELPVSDGSLAYEIMNFTANEEGFLESKMFNMPLIPKAWNQYDTTFNYPKQFKNVYAMKFIQMNGESPDLLIITADGVFRFSPSFRCSSLNDPRGSHERYNTSEIEADGAEGSMFEFIARGLKEQFLFKSRTVKDIEGSDPNDNRHIRTLVSVRPQATPMFPAQVESVGNRVYFTFCDGGGSYVWDGYRIREFGYQTSPSAPHVLGPASNRESAGSGGWNNGGGFSDGGRIGTLNYDLSAVTDEGEVVTSGGIEDGLWYYAVVFENQDGSYSATSEKSTRATIQFHVTNPDSERTKYGLNFLRRRFWINHIPTGPEGTVARILLRTMNLASLPSGEAGELRFLHRIPNNNAQQYMDDIPDSELGRVWEDRRKTPPGFYFMKFFGGSMFVMRTDDHPSRLWWSEQGTVTGSIPESFMQNSWRDIFPETGPITGAFSASVGGQQTLLIFKDKATHYVSNSYEQPGTSGWSFGTLSTVAGCSGPNLCQSTPDGYTIWYGNGTFWMWGKDTNGVIDIGAPIRKRLSKINVDNERFGVSWITKNNKEIVFCLPYKDSSVPDLQFIWDYRNRGWRLRQDVRATAVETVNDLTLIANKPEDDDRIYSPNVFVYQRGTPNQVVYSTNYESVYTTGWQSFAEFGPEFHKTHKTSDSVFTLQDRSNQSSQVYTYSDWNFDDVVNREALLSRNPEETKNIDTWSSGNYDDSVYRLNRTYTHRVPLDIPSCTVFSLSLRTRGHMSLISIDAYGPESSNETSRSPAIYEESNDPYELSLMTVSILMEGSE